MILIFNSF